MAYATVAELEAWMGRAAPDEAALLLERASTVVAFHVRRAVVTDSEGLPTDADDAAALRDATTAQVEHWLGGPSAPHEDDLRAELSLDGIVLSPGEDAAASGRTATPMEVSDDARRILVLAGLLGPVVGVR